MRHCSLKPLRRVAAALLALVLAAAWCLPCAAAETSGSCGPAATWQYADGTLTISGSGAMSDFSVRNPVPWEKYLEKIRVVKVEQGITAIGNRAFSNCPILATVSLPDSVTAIGKYAFSDCTSLKMITLGSALTVISDSAFSGCSSLSSIRLPDSLTTLGGKAFYRCDGLRQVTVPASVTTMGSMVFSQCTGLLTATVNANVTTLPQWFFYGCTALTRVTLSASVQSLGSKAFYDCNLLQEIRYGGTESEGQAVLDSVKETLPNFRENNFNATDTAVVLPSDPTVDKAQTSGGYIEGDKIISDSTTVQSTPNSTVSTTVTTSGKLVIENDTPKLEQEQESVKIEAVVENELGWGELVEQVKIWLREAAKSKDPEIKVSVSLNVNDETTLKKEVLAPIVGEDVKLTVEMKDGSSYRIDCQRLEDAITEETKEEKIELSHSLTANPTPTVEQTDVIGKADSYLLSFRGDSVLNYSPRIYLGTRYAHQCAVLYQQLDGEPVERVQSAIVSGDGYATFYLGKTLSTVQYFIALGVEGETYDKAIIPDELAVDMGVTAEYEPIQYVVTGERIFMGLNLSQFSFFLFGGLIALIVIVGIVMAVIYRKRRLEFMYRMRAAEEDALAQAAKDKDE